MKRLRVYLSSTFEDLKEYRAAVFAALEKAGLDVARMEAYTAADERPLDLCLRDVAQSEIYVGLYAWRYGYEPPADHGNPRGKSITELEYRQAESGKLRKLLFFAHTDTKERWPNRFKDEVTGEGKRGEKLNAFRKEVGTEKTASFFRTPDELATLVLAAIMRSGLSGRPYNVPPRPAGFIPRPNLTQQLVDSIVSTSAGIPGVNTLVQGAGGFGKTTLAIDACHRAEVVNAFPDGMLWIALGEKSDLTKKLSDLHVSATGSPPTVAGIDALGEVFAKSLAGRRCLVIVDDVWRPEDLVPFLRLDGPRLLVTTRIRTLIEQAGQTGWPEVPVDEMEVSEAAALLGRSLSLDDPTRDTLRGLVDRLGCWPLLLDLANARLLEEQKTRHGNLAEGIHRVIQLFERRGVLGFDRRDSNARNAAIAKSVEVSLETAEAMFPGLAEKAAEISIFPENVPIPVRVLANLWKMDEFDVEEEAMRPLDNISILRWDRQTNGVRMHNMVQRALAARLVDPAAANRKLINTWCDPYHLPHDYAWRWFGWHCVRANEQDRLLRLLLDFDWLSAKLAATEINALVGEFDHIRDDPRAELLQGACRRSAYVLAWDKSQLAGQLLARIPEHERQLRDRILARALAMHRTWLRPVVASLVEERSIRWLRPAQAESLSHVTFSRNGLWAAHVGQFGQFGRKSNVILWDLKKWRSYGTHFQARHNPFALALSDDGRWCLYADSLGGVYRLGASEAEFWEGHEHGDLTIAKLLEISADGRRALSACYRGRLVAWDIDAGCHEMICDESDNRVVSLSLDAAGDSAVAARLNGSVDVVDLWPARKRPLFELPGRPSALARSPDNTVVAVATTEGRIEVRSVESPEPAMGIFTTQEQPTSLAMSSDARYLAVGTDKGTVEVWSITQDARCARYHRAHTYEVTRITFSHDGTHVVSADLLQIKEWALEASDEEERGASRSRATGPVKVTADDLHAVAVLEDGRLGVWNIRTGALKSSLPRANEPAFGDPGIEPPKGIALAAKAPRVLSWNEKLLCVWDLEVGVSVGSLSVALARDAAITPDGAGVVYVNEKDVTFWRPDDGRSSVLGTYDDGPPGYVAISPDGQRALSSGGDRKVVVWRLNELSPTALRARPENRERHSILRSPRGHTPKIMGRVGLSGRALSAYEQVIRRQRELGIRSFWSEAQMASCWIGSRYKPAIVAFAGQIDAIVTTGDGSLFVFDTSKSGIVKARRLAGGHEAYVSRVLVTIDGRFAVTSSYDQTNRVWDLGEGQCIGVLDAHPGYIEKLSTAFDRALLSSTDGVIKIVRLDNGELLAGFQGDKQIITCDADAELQWVVACDQGGQMHFFHIEDGA